ncbi:MAG: cyanophycin synthetase [Anaerolineae bacterium]|nr:cyanophycin synthetase [Anaerolineae bacterium]
MDTYPVKVRNLRVLRGPNLYAYKPVLQITLDIGPYEERPSNSFSGFVERLTTWLPGLQRHECGVGRPGGFIERLERGTYLGHIVEHITLELQNLMGFNVSFGRARGTGERGVYNVVIAYEEEEPGRAAFETALRLTLAAMHDDPFDFEAELERLLVIADEYRLGPSTGAIVTAARARKIPVLRVTSTGSLVQLGYGVHQKRILASETSYTSAIAVDLCQDKSLTNHMLRQVGVPVPAGRMVKSAREAWQAAQEVGLPVVVKPMDGNQGKGVSVNLNSKAEVSEAFAITRQYSRKILVESYIEGYDFRLLVINGRLVAAAQRDPAQVVGDGQHTVAQLIEILNQDPRRRPGHGSILSRVQINEAVELTLGQQDMSLATIPAPGQVVKLRHNSNLSTGGTATDVTDEVHPRNARLAELAAQILALDVAGIDIVCSDIRRPLAEQGGAIVEVNAAPGLRMHLNPSQGQARQVGVPIVEMLYPGDTPARIPVIAITGTNGKTTVTRLVGHMYETARWVVGMTCTDGIYINKELIVKGDCSGPKSAQTILLHPHVEVAVLETARGGILREGLAFDRCLVGVVTNVTSDHLGLDEIKTLDQLVRVKQVVVEVVSSDGAAILNAEDPLVAEMAAATDAHVVYFSRDKHNHVIQAHLAEGGQGVFVEEGTIILATGTTKVQLVELERIPFTWGGKIGFQVMNALAATAAAWAAGLNPAMIVRALSTFEADAIMAPGRFNIFEMNGVEVILDYGHNAAALEALGEAVAALEPRRTVVAFTLPGDRRDEDIIATTKATIPFANAYVLYDSEDRRGRAGNEIPNLIRCHLPEDVPCEFAEGQPAGILQAWQQVRPGDRLIVICDEVNEALEVLHTLAEPVSKDASCINPLAAEESALAEREKNGVPVLASMPR